jgi:hypothetical protein
MGIMIQQKTTFGVYLIRQFPTLNGETPINVLQVHPDSMDVRWPEKATRKNHSDRHDAQAGRKAAL